MTTRSRPDRSSSGVKPRPRGGLYSEDLKDGRRYLGAADLLRLSAAGEIESLVARDAAALKAGLLFTPLPVDGDVDGQRRVGFEEFRSPLRKGHELLGWGKSGGWRRTPLTREKMAVLAPIPTARDDHEGEDPVAEQAADGLTDFGWHARLLRSARGFGSRQFASGDAQAAVVGGPGAVAEEVRGGVVRNEAEKFARSGVVERKRDVVVRLFGRRMLQTIHLTVRTSKRPDVLVSREG